VATQLRALEPIGVEVTGVDLCSPSNAEFDAIHAGLLAHGLLVFRGQQLGHEEQTALARRFGELEALGTQMGTAHPEVIAISNLGPEGPEGRLLTRRDPLMMSLAVNEFWHTDSSFREIPSTVSVFRAEIVPETGGGTWFASLRRGWLELDEAQRERLRGLRAVHDYSRSWDKLDASPPGSFSDPPVVHDLVRVHPETGEESLYLSSHSYSIEGMAESEGRQLLEELVEFCVREGRVYRHAWSPGDVLIWDNRCMIHRTEGFDETHPRLMYHVRVAGDDPRPAAGR
jgi:alpha-ketoglutarate-dependent taurine dioxygenase